MARYEYKRRTGFDLERNKCQIEICSGHFKHLCMLPSLLKHIGERTKRQGPPLTEGFADVRDGLEDAVGEVDLDLHVLHVGQLKAQEFVLRCEE